jgi:HEAT repeat protein
VTDCFADICNAAAGSHDQAVKKASARVLEQASFPLDLSQYLQIQCCARRVQLNAVLRGLEVLDVLIEDNKLFTVMRPFLRSSLPQVASKAVLIVGSRYNSFAWVRSMLDDPDERVRANLIESLWKRREPEAEAILVDALRDRDHRVAANAVYGLSLIGSKEFIGGLDLLIASHKPAFRRAAVWVIKRNAAPDAALRIRMLIHDPEESVRRAAFKALGPLRDQLGTHIAPAG